MKFTCKSQFLDNTLYVVILFIPVSILFAGAVAASAIGVA